MKRRRRAGEPSRVVSIDGRGPGDEGEAVGVDVPDAGRAPDQQVIDAHAARRLHRALIALPPTYRTIVRLRDIDGLSTRDVAAITGMSEAAVKTRLHRAHALLRRELQSSPHAI
jgi:RNA polymerase sigma-70 factor (ECF subfamily)